MLQTLLPAQYVSINTFDKADPETVAFFLNSGVLYLKGGTYVALNGMIYPFLVDTVVQMPALTAGTDYAIYVCNDGTIRASSNFSAPAGFTTATSRKIGGFHYALGGNAAGSVTKVAADTAFTAQTIPADKWGVYTVSINPGSGTITVTSGASNPAGYGTEALALADIPNPPAVDCQCGAVTVLTKAGTAWVAGTDALAGGSTGNVATTTNYYSAGATLSRGTPDTRIHTAAIGTLLGGNYTPQINPNSIWDLKWRPKNRFNDPRGLAYEPDGAWGMIYGLNTNPGVNGVSASGLMLADGSSPPKIPSGMRYKSGSNYLVSDGTVTAPDFTQYNAAEILGWFGFRLYTTEEFYLSAMGVVERTQRVGGLDPINTGIDGPHTSFCGHMQMTGNMWWWGREGGQYVAGADYATAIAFTSHDNTGGPGQEYSQGTYGRSKVILGGLWSSGTNCGSRSSSWNGYPWYSSNNIGARGRCDHLRLV